MSTLINEIIEIVSAELNKDKTVTIDENSAMNNPAEWDSMSFVGIFLAITAHFDLDVDDDDAMKFVSIKSIADFIENAS